MAYYLNCKITLDDRLVFRSAHAIEIHSSWKTLSDTCTIELPLRGIVRKGYRIREKLRIDQLVKTGQTVKIELGYDGNFITEFTGYVAEIEATTKLRIRCEDEMYLLKRQGNITKSYRKTNIKELLQELLPSVQLLENLPKITIDNYLIRRATKAFVLEELQKKYGLAVYFRNGKLHVGLPYGERIARGQRLEVFRNIVTDDLKYVRSEDVRLKVRAVSKLPNNRKITVEVGDADGEERTLYYYNVYEEETLKRIATADLKRFKFEGYRGKVTTFGIPYLQHSETVEVTHPWFQERTGLYLIDSVTTKFGSSGFRRDVELAVKVSR